MLANLLMGLQDAAPDLRIEVVGTSQTRQSLKLPVVNESGSMLQFRRLPGATNYLVRSLWQQLGIPLVSILARADCVLSVANAGAVFPTVRQYIYFHNALYLFPEYFPSSSRWTRLLRAVQWLLIRLSMYRSQGVIVQTEAVRRVLVEKASLRPERVVVIPPGVPETLETPQSSVRANPSDGVSLDLLYVSHPAPHKNVECLLRALALAVETVPELRLLLTMEGHTFNSQTVPFDPSTYAGYVARYQALARTLKVENSVVWTGVLTPKQVRASLRTCVALCFPSYIESFPQPLVEAMALGAPVIAADRPYAREICGDVALLADPNDPKLWAEHFVTLVRNLGLRRQLSEAGKQRSQRYSYRRAAESIVALLTADSRRPVVA